MRLGAFQRGGEGVRLDEAEFQRLLSLERLGEQEKLGRLGAPEALRREQRGAGLTHEARIDEGRQRGEVSTAMIGRYRPQTTVSRPLVVSKMSGQERVGALMVPSCLTPFGPSKAYFPGTAG